MSRIIRHSANAVAKQSASEKALEGVLVVIAERLRTSSPGPFSWEEKGR
ncbi:hypothetical protein [Leptothoe spongobia]|uniref:Uncharacterized protein n=1 Tax=Leptothoe spongobia TAU-MAC 1115 TaxID=1967444 RepID=A0A947DAD1_9CYAN|nr:hypothetical protein [Leptothoe spongobia]MBT9313850.1 hypothetical protein [Leptothoe spongobia TAU-MAC 1115]